MLVSLFLFSEMCMCRCVLSLSFYLLKADGAGNGAASMHTIFTKKKKKKKFRVNDYNSLNNTALKMYKSILNRLRLSDKSLHFGTQPITKVIQANIAAVCIQYCTSNISKRLTSQSSFLKNKNKKNAQICGVLSFTFYLLMGTGAHIRLADFPIM